MIRVLIVLFAALSLGACAGNPRTEPPAPVVNRGVAAQGVAQPQPPPPPEVEVYPYRPPGSAPDGSAAEPPADPGGVSEPPPAQSAGSATTWSLPAERATQPPAQAATDAAPAQTVVAYAPPTATATAPTLAPAADTLARQAEQQRQARDYVGAAATLERALRIAPQEPYLWNRLARVRLEQGLPGQAGNLAARSNALASDSDLKQDNWAVIAAARRAAGDVAGAEEAERRARGG